MATGINNIDGGPITVYNGTGSAIAMGARLTLAVPTAIGAAQFGVTLTGNAAICDAVALEPIADGENGAAKLRNDTGFLQMIAAAAVTFGATVTAAASGKVSTGGGTTEGIAFSAAGADGDLILVRPAL
jgi:hypothetical protein